MRMYRFKCSLIFLTFLINLSNAHIRMVCPRPVSARSDLKSQTVSLGKNACRANEGSELDVLEVHPGLFTIRFEETKFMIGSPFRIILFNSLTSEGHTNDVKRNTNMRSKRDAVETTTQDNTIIIQNVLDMVNHTLNSIDSPNDSNSKSNNHSMDKSTGDEGIITGSTTVIIKEGHAQAINDTAESNTVEENSTVAGLHDLTSQSMSEDVTTQGSGKKEPEGGRASSGSESSSKTGGASQSCLLMDHVPHNDQAIVSDHCSKNGNSYPLGACEESTYYVTIRIPDLFCPDCLLVVQQVEARPDHEVCDLSSGNESYCDSYISCSRINIRPTSEGMHRNLSYCSNYLDNLPDDWAYRPQDIYEAGDSAVFTMDLLHQDLHLEVYRGLNVGPMEQVEIRHNQKIIWKAKESQSHKNADSLLLVWYKVPGQYLPFLKKNQLVLNIIGSKKSQALDIVFKSQIFSEGKISLLHDTYSNHGWLIANRFLGPTAKDPMAALPVGPCVPIARHFLVFFEAVEAGYHGILGMTLLENRAYITAILHVELGTIQSIRFKGSRLVGAEDVVIKIPNNFSGILQVALDFTQQVKYIDTVQFLKTVEVKTNRQDAIMVGTLEEGFYALLRDRRGRVKGVGAFQPTQGYWMRAEIVLADMPNPNPKVKAARLLGNNVELMDLTKEVVNCTRQFCCLETYVHELSSEFLLHLLSGQVRVTVTTQSDDFSGQIVGSSDCTRYGGLCLMNYSLSKNNAFTKRFGGTANAVISLDRAEVLDISIQVNHAELDLTANNYSAILTMKGSRHKIQLNMHLTWISEELYSSKVRFPLLVNSDMYYHVENDFHFHVTNKVHTLMEGEVHGLRRKECIQTKIHVVGKDKNFWSPVSYPLDVIYGVVLDFVKFIYDSNSTSLYLMESEESFSKCDFNKSKKIETTTSMGGLAINFFKLTSPGAVYFADKDSCQSDTPAKLMVMAVKGRESLVQDQVREEWCRMSFYLAWKEGQLAKWDPPSVGGPIVLGLFLGLTSAIGFILWQGMKMKQMPSHSASSSRNSLSHFVRF